MPTTPPVSVLPKLTPELQELYDSLMDSARGCENDREALMQDMASFAMLHAMPGFSAIKTGVLENERISRILEESFLEAAHGILKAGLEPPAA